MPISEAVLLESLKRRFWERANKRRKNQCWLWSASLTTQGYARIGHGSVWKLASHVSLFLRDGIWPDKGAHVLHTCDTPACVNPNHLWVGDQFQNMQDCVSKGRHASTRKTMCKHGHTLADAYPYRGKRVCKTCANVRYQKQRDAGKRKGVAPRTNTALI